MFDPNDTETLKLDKGMVITVVLERNCYFYLISESKAVNVDGCS